MYEFPYYFPNDLRIKKLANFKNIPEKLGIEGSPPAAHPEAKFRQLC